jgi:trans-aconitate methyltransferase
MSPRRVAPNCQFEIDDFELDWNFSYSFDFIHARNLEGSVRDHHKLFSQAFKNLNGGGWFEAADATVGIFCDDDTIERAPSLLEWRDRLIEASHIFNKPMGVAKNYKQWIIDAGFVNVKEEIYKVYLPDFKFLFMNRRGLMGQSTGSFLTLGQRPEDEGTG